MILLFPTGQPTRKLTISNSLPGVNLPPGGNFIFIVVNLLDHKL